jgi:predicted TIM-barrel fold metal-dependent hydrolase
MPKVDFRIFDADNHYYESTDAFTRHLDRGMQRRALQWAELNGRQVLLVAGKLCRFIPNPTFDPVARPGCLDQYYRGNNPNAHDIRTAFGELVPIHPCYRMRDERTKMMDTQGIEKTFMFPTLGVGIEEALRSDPEACHAAFHAFNQWLIDDWGYAYQDRIFSTPYIPLLDPDLAVAELEWVLARDARAVCLRAAPAWTKSGPTSPADPVFDPFWARANEAGVTITCHGGDSGYGIYAEMWGEAGSATESFKSTPLKNVMIGNRAPYDWFAALICHGLPKRFPNLRFASIEMGSNWVPYLLQNFRRAYGQDPALFSEDPIATFKRHVWVSPFHEDDVPLLRDLLGADRLLMGSDWPHAEGLAEPVDYVNELEGFSQAEIRRVMRDNALELSLLRPASH